MKYTDLYRRDLERARASAVGVEALFKKRILITGATGMLLSPVVDYVFYLNETEDAGIDLYLAGRDGARTAARFPDMKEGRDYYFVPFDAAEGVLEDTGADYYIHGASPADPAAFMRRPFETMNANLAGLAGVLERALRAGAERVLYISSSEVYGRRPAGQGGLFKEDEYGFLDLLNPRSAYPSAKRAAETMCISFMTEYGLPVVIVRPGHIYGPSITSSDSRASAAFARDAAAGRDIVLKSAGTQTRSYTYMLDSATAVLSVLTSGEAGEAYNISNRDSIHSIREMAEAMAAAGGVRVLFSDATDTERAGFNPMDTSALDAGKLEALGWRAVFSLEEGAERSVALLGEMLPAAREGRRTI